MCGSQHDYAVLVFYLLIELADCLEWLDANMTLNEDRTTWAREWVDETRTTQQTVETSGVILGWEHNDGMSRVTVQLKMWNGNFCHHHQWSVPMILSLLFAICCPFVAMQWAEEARFINVSFCAAEDYHGDHHCHYHHGPSPAQGLTNAKVSVGCVLSSALIRDVLLRSAL